MSRRFAAVLLLVTLGAFTMAIVSEVNRQSSARCQAQYNEINNRRTRALTESTAKERAAERRWRDALNAVFKDPSNLKPADQRTAADRERVRSLFVEYLDAIVDLEADQAAADRSRAANPVPPAPSQICG